MNDNKGIRLWQWTALLLALCNIALMVTIWVTPRHEGEAGRHEKGPRDFVIRSLKFTSEQTKQYDTLIEGHQAAMRRLRQEADKYRRQLFDNLSNNNANSTVPDSLARLIANNQAEVELVTYRHFAQVRALCTAEQKKEFDNITEAVIKKMHGGPHGSAPPGNGPPDDLQGPPRGGEDGPPPPPDGPQNP